MGNLTFNGVSTKDLGVEIQSQPLYTFSDRTYDIIHVEGKNGDFIIDKGSYQNTKRQYSLVMDIRNGGNFVTSARKVVEWLNSVNGYARLEDSYESDYFRMALYQGPGELPNYFDDATAIDVSFNCKPQRYLKSGDEKISITKIDSYVRVYNPTKFVALPEITRDGDDLKLEFFSGSDYNSPINYSVVESTFNEEFIIDSDLQDCFNSERFVNNLVMLTNLFPKLYPGINYVKATGTSLRKLEIKPRWWTL